MVVDTKLQLWPAESFSPGTTQPIVGVYFTALYRALASSRTRLLDHTQRHVTVGRSPLNEWSVHRRDLYLTTHNTHNRQTSMPQVGFEPTITAGERPQIYDQQSPYLLKFKRTINKNAHLLYHMSLIESYFKVVTGVCLLKSLLALCTTSLQSHVTAMWWLGVL